VAVFIPRIIEIKENISVSRWFGSNANIVFDDAMLHIHVYVSVATIRKFLISQPSKPTRILKYGLCWYAQLISISSGGHEQLIYFGYGNKR
jgi:hypothetical protein